VVVVYQVVCAAIEFCHLVELSQAGDINWDDFEVKWVLPDRFEAPLICGWDVITIVGCFRFHAKDVNVILGVKQLVNRVRCQRLY
jgi:hypothetical protein